MPLSAPIHHLKRRAKVLSRQENIPLHLALDRIASGEGFGRWSLLLAKAPPAADAARLLAQFSPGDLVLLGARPGQGKTLMSLRLAAAAVDAGRRTAFFTLEYTLRDVLDRFAALGIDPASIAAGFSFDGSDDISAGYIIEQLADAAPGTLVVVDYLQLLDQRRDRPPLEEQIRTLSAFARARGLIFIFITQIDRSYDPERKPCPDRADIRLPNPVDLTLFQKALFLGGDGVKVQDAVSG